ncbi:MAG: AlpA family phage regulatory protein [Comamonas sp.]
MAKSRLPTSAQLTKNDVLVDAKGPRIDPAFFAFDSLPDVALVHLPVVQALFACSRATVWRRVKSGQIPAPLKLSERTTVWQVASLRKHLIALGEG